METIPTQIQVEDDRTGLSLATLRRDLADNLFFLQGKFPGIATKNDYYMALAYTVRDRLLHRWLNTTQTYLNKDVKVVCYLSAEFLMGPHLANNLINLGLYERVRQATEASGLDLQELIEAEEEPGLGNGGLGRLAACYLDSLATLEIPAIGYGIRYEFGIFDQEIRDGWQVEITDKWLRYGNPWEIAHPEEAVEVKLGGHTKSYQDERGNYRVHWISDRVIKGIPCDTSVLGFQVIIKLINSVADVINHDPDVGDRLKIVFFPDFNVTNAQKIYPAADLSEQISTAGKEASGTGNMKFSMNGALTIGTLDGANIEIRSEVGAENFFLFGLTAEEVQELQAKGYNPGDYYHANAQLKEVIDLISSGFFSHGDSNLFKPLIDSLFNQDQYLLFADYQSYVDCQDRVSQVYRDREQWTKMSILNVARMGKFSSDRSIREYCQDIWKIEPVHIELEELCPDGTCSLV